MTTDQMVKELRNNPKKKFISKFCGADCDEAIAEVIANSKLIVRDKEGIDLCLRLDREWEEVKQPVNVTEAMKAYEKEGKDIECVLNSFSYTFDSGCYCGEKGRSLFNGITIITSKMILEGTWYIL